MKGASRHGQLDRRRLLMLALSLSAVVRPSPGRADATGLAQAWPVWRESFLSPQGRVIDHEQLQASHSEGQAYGLLLAEAADDEATFERIEAWTMAHLMVRQDRLMGWRWLPATGVEDWNTASDGDLLRAWALLRAARRWNRPELLERARGIAQDLAWICLHPDPRDAARRVLLPGARDFVTGSGVILNPSYLMPRAMREIATVTGVADWAGAAGDGERLLAELLAGGLPPDWIALGTEGFAPAPGRSDLCGYDALRIPLYLVWSGAADHPAVRAMTGAPPTRETVAAVTRTRAGAAVARSDLEGYRAIGRLARCAPLAPYRPGQPYYPATLQLLCSVAAMEAAKICSNTGK